MGLKMSEDLKAYKWLVSSCLQKSIRRGRFDLAEPYVKFLWEHDRSYITYRFGTVLTEDIGIANLELVSKYLDTKLAKKQIDAKGGVDFFLELTKEACESAKDRSSCDAAYLAQYFSLNLNNRAEAEKLFNDTNANYVDRINTGWSLLGGKKFKTESLNFLNPVTEPATDDIEYYVHQVEKITNPLIANLVKNAYATQVENICLGVPIIESLYQKEIIDTAEKKFKAGRIIENTYVREEVFFHKETGLDLISCGMDGHTREGKSVYYNFLKSKQDFTAYMNEQKVPFEKHIDLFLHSMFRTEGHEVNKRIYFPTAVTVMRDCEEKVLNFKADLPQGTLNFATIKEILIDAMPTINHMKRESLSKSQANSFIKRKF